MTILYRDGPPVDPLQLQQLFAAVGARRSLEPAFLQAMVEGSRWVASAWEGTRLVGFARAVSDGVSNGYINTVAVHPDYQRQGIGRTLIHQLIDGREQVKFVLHTSVAGERLYRSLGFVDATSMLVRPRAGELP